MRADRPVIRLRQPLHGRLLHMHGAQHIVDHVDRAMELHGMQIAIDSDATGLLGMAAVEVQLVEQLALVGVREVDDVLAVHKRKRVQHVQRINEY